MDTDDLILKEGEQGLISLSFYTEKGKPYPQILQGKFFGTYNILISSIYITEKQITCDVIAIGKTEQFSLKIIPNKVSKCHYIQDSLPNAKSGELFNLKYECLDSYGNKAILEDGNFAALIKNENSEIFEYNINLNEDNSFSLYFIPTKSGKYSIDSIYQKKEI